MTARGQSDGFQAFARLSAVFGGTYMLNKPDAEVVYEDGKVVGVKSGDAIAKCSFVVGDPSYFPDKVEKLGQVVRAFCIMDHPIPDTDNAFSTQIILPQNQIKRKSDMYVFCCSYAYVLVHLCIIVLIDGRGVAQALCGSGRKMVGLCEHHSRDRRSGIGASARVGASGTGSGQIY